MGFYDDTAVDVDLLIAEFGALLTLKRTDSGGAVTERTFRAVFDEKVPGSNFGDSGVKEGDWKVICDTTAQLQKSDVVIANGIRYSVVTTEAIQPGGQSVGQWAWLRIA